MCHKGAATDRIILTQPNNWLSRQLAVSVAVLYYCDSLSCGGSGFSELSEYLYMKWAME